MGYTIPSLEESRNQVKHADATLSEQLKRFIPPHDYDKVRANCVKLAKTYCEKVASSNRNSWFLSRTPDNTRIMQSRLIALLATGLKENTEENKAILYGAIFHRLLRIKAQQDGAYVGRKAAHTTLYPILCGILEIQDEDVDNDVIDPLSVYQCLVKFKNYVKNEDVANALEYIKDDKDFYVNLESMISHYDKLVKNDKKMLDQVLFVQSVAHQLTACHDNALRLIKGLIATLAIGPVNKENLTERLSTITLDPAIDGSTAECSRQYLMQCWSESREMTSDNAQEQIVQLRGLLDGKTRYLFLGLLYLAHEHTIDKADRTTIRSIMNWNLANPLKVDSDPEDYSSVKSGLEFLKTFIFTLLTPKALETINFQAYGNKERLQSRLNEHITQFRAAEPIRSSSGLVA